MTDFRYLSDTFAVAPQISLDDVAALKEAGFKTIVCNRPDAEVTPDVAADAIRSACEETGMAFVLNPLSHGALTMDHVDIQRAAALGEGPVLAYCASGNRSSILWGLGIAGDLTSDQIIDAAAKAGYNLAGLAPQIDALAAQRTA